MTYTTATETLRNAGFHITLPTAYRNIAEIHAWRGGDSVVIATGVTTGKVLRSWVMREGSTVEVRSDGSRAVGKALRDLVG